MTITHGTPAGVAAGCVGGGRNCPNHGTPLMTCAEALTRFRSDYGYRKAMLAGRVILEREQLDVPRPVAKVVVVQQVAKVVKPKPPKTRAPKVRAPKPVVAKAPVAPKPVDPAARMSTHGRRLGPVKHGTQHAFRVGCTTIEDCPNRALGLETCREFSVRYQAEYRQQRKFERHAGIQRVMTSHGTLAGYKAGCQSGSPCPASPSCTEIQRTDERNRRRRNGVLPKPTVQHGTRSGYKRFKCRDRVACPGIAERGQSCYRANSIHNSEYRARRAS